MHKETYAEQRCEHAQRTAVTRLQNALQRTTSASSRLAARTSFYFMGVHALLDHEAVATPTQGKEKSANSKTYAMPRCMRREGKSETRR